MWDVTAEDDGTSMTIKREVGDVHVTERFSLMESTPRDGAVGENSQRSFPIRPETLIWKKGKEGPQFRLDDFH